MTPSPTHTKIGTVSPQPGFTQPEILREAKQWYISDEFSSFLKAQKVFDLLSGQLSSSDPQQEAYRILLVAVCNHYNRLMPFMFEKINDYTELLMPDDLLSESSVLNRIRDAISVESEKWEVMVKLRLKSSAGSTSFTFPKRRMRFSPG